MVDKKLLAILACPQCKAKVEYNAKSDCLTCLTCQLVYPVRDDIPVMLVEEASALVN